MRLLCFPAHTFFASLKFSRGTEIVAYKTEVQVQDILT